MTRPRRTVKTKCSTCGSRKRPCDCTPCMKRGYHHYAVKTWPVFPPGTCITCGEQKPKEQWATAPIPNHIRKRGL